MQTKQTKERPILFYGQMVRAILDGRKTQTRRVVKEPLHEPLMERAFAPGCNIYRHADKRSEVRCPFGRVGNRLWVREAWRTGIEWDDTKPTEIDPLNGGGHVRYKADGSAYEHSPLGSLRFDVSDNVEGWGRHRSPIHMPRWASRLTLEITGVRVERVQSICEQDAIAEGVRAGTGKAAQARFVELWDSINSKRGHGWDVNPWVWVVEFERVNDAR